MSSCPICSEGFESSAHTCIVCNKGVHVLKECSVEITGDEEGHGQKRMCLACHNGEFLNKKKLLIINSNF